MRELYYLTKRNILVYLKDKSSVFFSFLSIIILLVIYLIFLKNVMGGIEGLNATQKAVFFVGYVMGGVLVVGTITLSFGVIGNYVSDQDGKKINGILVTPVNRTKITLSYYISTALVTTVFIFIMFFLIFLFLGISYGYWYSASTFFSALALLVLYVAISTPIMIFIVSFIKSMNSFGAVSSIVGTLIGFVSGIYIPLSALDSVTQTIAGIMPFSHMTLYLRKLLMGELLEFLPAEALEEAGLSAIKIFGLNVPVSIVLIFSLSLSMMLMYVAYMRMNKKQTG